MSDKHTNASLWHLWDVKEMLTTYPGNYCRTSCFEMSNKLLQLIRRYFKAGNTAVIAWLTTSCCIFPGRGSWTRPAMSCSFFNFGKTVLPPHGEKSSWKYHSYFNSSRMGAEFSIILSHKSFCQSSLIKKWTTIDFRFLIKGNFSRSRGGSVWVYDIIFKFLTNPSFSTIPVPNLHSWYW